ncbi:MAG TPA: class I SAM-dependent methyltransferase [Ktedonobacterales bacterium]
MPLPISSPLDALRSLLPERWSFTLAYLRGLTPWDTGVSPPELVEVVEGDAALPPGRALDLGCGTGTNALYLARHGWHATGIDFAAPAISRAQEKLRTTQDLTGSAHFLRGDVTRLDALALDGPYTLLLDLGCFHNLEPADRTRYASGITHYAAADALYLLYAFGPRIRKKRRVGATPDEVRTCFRDHWAVERIEQGADTGHGWPSAWYWLRKMGR